MWRLGSLLTLWMSSLLAHLGSGELWVVCSSSTLGGEAIDITAKSVSILEFFMSHASAAAHILKKKCLLCFAELNLGRNCAIALTLDFKVGNVTCQKLCWLQLLG